MKYIVIIVSFLVITASIADDVYDNGLFGLENQNVQLKTEQQFIEYIKTNKPSTFTYYQRLSTAAQKRVFTSHLEDKNKDITEIVLKEYRNRG